MQCRSVFSDGNGRFYEFVFDSHAVCNAIRETDGGMIPLM